MGVFHPAAVIKKKFTVLTAPRVVRGQAYVFPMLVRRVALSDGVGSSVSYFTSGRFDPPSLTLALPEGFPVGRRAAAVAASLTCLLSSVRGGEVCSLQFEQCAVPSLCSL